MKIEIDCDKEEALRKLTMRELVGVHILMIVFRIIFPVKYSHQLNEFTSLLGELKK